MNYEAFARIVRSDNDWKVSITLSQTNSRIWCHIHAWHAFGGFIHLSDGITVDNPAVVLKAVLKSGMPYQFSNSSDLALLAELGLTESGDPLPAQSVERPALKHSTKPCRICGKTSFKTPKNCANPVNSLSGGWQCQLNREFVGTALVTRQDFIVQYRGGRL